MIARSRPTFGKKQKRIYLGNETVDPEGINLKGSDTRNDRDSLLRAWLICSARQLKADDNVQAQKIACVLVIVVENRYAL